VDERRALAQSAARAAPGGSAPADPEGFAGWMRPHCDVMGRLARQLGGNDRKDVLHEALSAAWRKRAQFASTRGSARNWLHRQIDTRRRSRPVAQRAWRGSRMITDPEARLRHDAAAWRAQDLATPSLEAMPELTLSQRSRHRPVVAIAATVLAVVGIATITLVRYQHKPPVRAAATSKPVAIPTTTTNDGTTVHLSGYEGWTDPVLDERNPRVVWIFASFYGNRGHACEAVPVAYLASQQASGVTVRVATYVADPPPLKPGFKYACTAILLPPARLKIVLAQPLGSRMLVDATTQTSEEVLDPATVLKPTYVPRGFIQANVGWESSEAGSPASGRTAVAKQREYIGPGSDTFTITMGPPSINRPSQHIISRTTVRGHPATVSYTGGFDEDMLVAWNEDPTHAVTIYQMGTYEKRYPALSANELVKIANSLR
jgi:hypothetical protein